ncbi:MAG: hypothetical protein ACR2MG_05265 [Pyrinomonadaceae bacterium]
MKLANKAFVIALTMLALIISMSAQTPRSAEDPRNTAPTVGTGGPPGGPTGLFTVYDGQTLRRGEFTFSAAYSNYDRDPGNVDITEIPVSFQIGLSDHLELFFNTDAYRAIKVNSPRNLSGFYLPNSQFLINGVNQSAPAIVLAPRGGGTSQFPGAVFRPLGNQPFIQFPFTGGFAGTFGFQAPFTSGGVFGFPAGTPATLGPPRDGGGNGADLFPGVGSVFGGILPGVVLQTVCLNGTTTCAASATAPTVFTVAPSYLPDAPLLNRQYGESAFNTFTVGAKYRFTGPSNPIGVGLIPFYRFYADSSDSFSGFNQLQRGASPGGGGPNPFSNDKGRGDFGLVAFADARLRKWLNISGNIGYIYNSSIKDGTFTLLDRPDEVLAGIALDFPVNKFFQPILEGRSTQYVGGRTPNAFENSPIEGLAGARVYPTRYISLSGAYRYHFNSQDRDSFDGNDSVGSVDITGRNTSISTRISGVPPGFVTSTDPHGFIFQVTAGRRNARGVPRDVNKFADVTNLDVSDTRVTIPCPPGEVPREGGNCSSDMVTNVTTTAVDPEGDVLTYNYTVSGGRIAGSGANVTWDLTGVNPGTYTITAGVDDGCGVCGKTQTKTITVEKCDCVPDATPCTCPTLSVTGPSAVTKAGDTMTFTANVSGGTQGEVTYDWTVSQGEIISGQGTPVITVQTTAAMAGQNVTATVNISDADLCTSCEKSRSEVAGIGEDAVLTPLDTFGDLKPDDIKARVDSFYIELGNNPSAQGYIINYGSARDIARREKQIRDAIRFLRRDPSRVTFVRGGDRGNGIETVFFVVPSGIQPPTPEQ